MWVQWSKFTSEFPIVGSAVAGEEAKESWTHGSRSRGRDKRKTGAIN